ncbi:cytochrome c [Acidobacteria bacterium AH-259-D05]|nr:cytochrome c [Acidobacteria bacterium AH-259-D05]
MSNLIQHFLSWWKSRKLDQRPVPEEDPIAQSSLAMPIAISSLLLMLSLFWALYDETWGLRPWITYQEDFIDLYREALIDLKPKRAEEEQEIYSSEGYQQLQQRIREAEAEIEAELAEAESEERALTPKLAAITKPFITARSRLQASIYKFETASESSKPALEEELEELRAGPYTVDWPEGPESYTYEKMEEEFNALKAQQGDLQARRVELSRGPTELRRELAAFENARLTSLTEGQVEGLLRELDDFRIEIKQIHNAEMGLVDRCESCHAGVRKPVLLTRETMGGRAEFSSHPSPQMLQIHDPETFGCSPCHNGNGVATVNPTQAHGLYKHWLWPLYSAENFEAGCLQCHEADRRLEIAPTLDAGKQLYYQRGCMGCHAREGFDPEPRLLRETQKSISDLLTRRNETELLIQRAVQSGDSAETNEEAERLYAQADVLTLSIADIDTELAGLQVREADVMMEVKKVGPNLKEVRMKLKKEWIPVWIQNPHDFRPTTKMPRFPLEEDQVRAISAYIWQSGIQALLPRQLPGDQEKGKTLFETRGCMACHSIGEADEATGGTFAANLSRVGEKANYDYLVRWIHNPRERTLPYCPVHQREITPEDYASQGLPFEFDLEHNKCPLGDHLLQVQQPTIMPNLRLSWEEARDIASYLMTQKHENAEYLPASYLDDPGLQEEGRFLVQHFGCAGCHEISGFEDEGKIGTDLTKEGSKPIERLDFALLTEEARHEDWYNHKGFFEHKLADPAVFDQGKVKAPRERLRMPNFDLSPEEITQLTTFLLGSVDSRFPETSFYQPSDQRDDIQKGWWVVMKYNCVACHQFTPRQKTVMEELPLYQDPDWREQLPPSLVGEGARVDPNWLSRFLKNPALDQTDVNRNGVRLYLEARMPTFNLSDGEVQQLVRFFAALSKQPLPYTPPQLQPLSSRELAMARELFTHTAAPCLTCHATGDPVTDETATAPNFLLVPERLKSDWTERWIVHPEIIRPGTNMPSGLFRQEGSRWVFGLADVPALRGYDEDHAKLMVRYMFQYSPAEQRRLTGR